MQLPENIEKEVARLKAYFPYRFVWVAHKAGVWDYGCSRTRRQLNDKLRAGWEVGTV